MREVSLLPEALDALLKMKEQTANLTKFEEIIYYKNDKTKTISRRRVFLSRGNQPFKRPELTTTSKQWSNWLKKANLTHRTPYQLRHTYASQCLMAGADPSWLAKQMGHKDWGMIRKIYGKWIKNENPNYADELAKKLGQAYT